MPFLGEAPIMPALTGASLVGALNPAESPTTLDEADLIQVFDVSTGQPKVISVANFMTALGIAPT
jgi:hypothetical protein